MNRALIPQAWRDSVEAYQARVAIRRQGRIAEAERQRVLDDIERNALADMSPVADRGRSRRDDR